MRPLEQPSVDDNVVTSVTLGRAHHTINHKLGPICSGKSASGDNSERGSHRRLSPQIIQDLPCICFKRAYSFHRNEFAVAHFHFIHSEPSTFVFLTLGFVLVQVCEVEFGETDVNAPCKTPTLLLCRRAHSASSAENVTYQPLVKRTTRVVQKI